MDVFGYIDPGTGSVFVQAVIGTVLAGAFVLRNSLRQLFYKLKSVFSRSATSATAKIPASDTPNEQDK